jgi:type I restriction enzyme S subunit
MPIALPPLNIQQTIASILSAYDNLIENNTSRMRILETLSQMIYREWFVNLRFPGHQSVGIVESEMGQIPEGWKATSLGENVSLESGKRPKGGIREETDGVPSIGAENINGIGKHHFENEKLVSRAFYEAMQRGVVRDRDVALYKDGAYIGKSSYFRDGFPHRECCVNEHVFVLRGIGTRLTQNFLYLWLQEPDTVQAIRATNANAAQPGINQQSVNGLDILLPDEEIAARFDRTVEPLLAELVNLAKQNVNLRETRDLLLPKLISGEVSVEHVETESVLESV